MHRMPFFSSLFGHQRRPVPPAPRPAPVHAVPVHAVSVQAPVAVFPLGLNVHNLTDTAIAAIGPLHVRQVRTTVYADAWAAPTGDAAAKYRATTMGRLTNALAAGLDVLVVVHGGRPSGWVPVIRELARRLPALTIQVGNEGDTDAGTIAPADYVALWRMVRDAVGSATHLVTLAGGSDSALYARALTAAGIVPDAVAVHAYGPPPATALIARVAPLRAATTSPIWCTEFGIAPRDIRRAWPTDDPARDEARQAVEWQAVAAVAPGRVARAYGYCLDAEEGAGYGILRADGSRRPTAAWLAARGA